jgi:hypothetical protein
MRQIFCLLLIITLVICNIDVPYIVREGINSTYITGTDEFTRSWIWFRHYDQVGHNIDSITIEDLSINITGFNSTIYARWYFPSTVDVECNNSYS